MSEKNESSKGKTAARVVWTDAQFELFVDLCVRGTGEGRRSGGGWGEKGWLWLESQMKATGEKISKEQMRHKWDWMKSQWKQWKELIGKHTGLGWDPVKKTIVADEQFWADRIQENPTFAKLRHKGTGEELYSKYEIIFMGTVATGEYAYAPSSKVLPSDTDNANDNDIRLIEKMANLEEDFEEFLNSLLQENIGSGTSSAQATSANIHLTENGGPTTQENAKKQKKKDELNSPQKKGKRNGTDKKNQSGALFLSNSVKELKTSMDVRTSAIRETFGDRPGCSIAEVMEDVLTLPKVIEDDELHLFCTILFESKSKREMYRTRKTTESKEKWLQFNYTLWQNGLLKNSTQ